MQDSVLFMVRLRQVSVVSLSFQIQISNCKTQKIFIKFRIYDHRLQFEVGHYKAMPKEDTVFIRCRKDIDDECHFFLHCHRNMNMNTKLESF